MYTAIEASASTVVVATSIASGALGASVLVAPGTTISVVARCVVGSRSQVASISLRLSISRPLVQTEAAVEATYTGSRVPGSITETRSAVSGTVWGISSTVSGISSTVGGISVSTTVSGQSSGVSSIGLRLSFSVPLVQVAVASGVVAITVIAIISSITSIACTVASQVVSIANSAITKATVGRISGDTRDQSEKSEKFSCHGDCPSSAG